MGNSIKKALRGIRKEADESDMTNTADVKKKPNRKLDSATALDVKYKKPEKK